MANGRWRSARGGKTELRKKVSFTTAVTGAMRGTWVVKHRRPGNEWRHTLQAGPNVALWGDAEVQEGVRKYRKVQDWT